MVLVLGDLNFFCNILNAFTLHLFCIIWFLAFVTYIGNLECNGIRIHIWICKCICGSDLLLVNWWMDGQVEINIDIWRKKRIHYVYDLSRNNAIAFCWYPLTVVRSGRSPATASFSSRLVICLLIWRNLDSSASPFPNLFGILTHSECIAKCCPKRTQPNARCTVFQ